MTSEKQARSDIWDRTYQIGVVVRDLDRAKMFYERLGIGPFNEGPSGSTLERRIYGEPAPDAAVRGAIAKMGEIEFELLEPVSGNTIQSEFLERHGEGVVHLCAFSDDLDRDIKELTDLGYDVISEGRIDDGGHFAYFDTRETGGLVLELFEPGPDWR
jgi:catechol 2,3-dioxygenase-like lactoylglutathione lyase family enzyme